MLAFLSLPRPPGGLIRRILASSNGRSAQTAPLLRFVSVITYAVTFYRQSSEFASLLVL